MEGKRRDFKWKHVPVRRTRRKSASPLTALENFKTGLYDLAIIDTRMPYMSGFEVYRRFKELDKKSKSVLFGTR
jgi:DNA-binding response OmpR family regulator